MKKQILLFNFILYAILFLPGKLPAAPYYEKKVLRIIVGFSPGGGYDRLARLLAKHLPKYIPGKPSIIIENMPGATSIIATNHLYNIAKPDGLIIGSYERGLPIAQLLKAEGVKFDLTKFSWVGSMSSEATALYLRTDLPYKTFDDLLKAKEPIMVGYTGPADTSGHFPLLLREFLGVNLKLITYIATPEIMLAIERKEVDGRAGSYSSQKPYIERGLTRAFIRGRVSEPAVENLPVDEDLCSDKNGKTIMAMRSAPDRIGRPFVAPPGTPNEAINILRDAFAKVAKDPELQGESKKIMMTVEYTPADECLKVLHYVFNQPEAVVKEFSKYIKF